MEYDLLDLNEKTINDYLSCFENNNNKKNIKKVEWQFFENKLPNDFVVIAKDSVKSRTAGIYAMSPVNFQINGDTFLGAQSLDTITDINYRGKGMFTNLANLSYKKGEEKGLRLVYGFPNGNSIHGFSKKLAWQVLDPVPFLIRPLNTKYFTKKIKYTRWIPNINLSMFIGKSNPSNNIVEEFSFPEQVNLLWNNFSEHIKVSVKRDKSYLDWRYIKKPNENYKILHSYDKNNNYQGFIVYCIKEKHDGIIGYIMELIYEPSKTEVGVELLKKAIEDIKDKKADTILTWCFDFSPNYMAFKKCNFFNLPEKLRPIELHFGARIFDSKDQNIIIERANWYLSYSDSDTV